MTKLIRFFITIICLCVIGQGQAYSKSMGHDGAVEIVDCHEVGCIESTLYTETTSTADHESHDSSTDHHCEHVCGHGNALNFVVVVFDATLVKTNSYSAYKFSHTAPFLKGFKRPPVAI